MLAFVFYDSIYKIIFELKEIDYDRHQSRY